MPSLRKLRGIHHFPPYRQKIIADSENYIYDYDDNKYHYVTIGTQQWLVENLKTEHYADGTPIPNLTLDADWIAEDGTVGHDGALCYYNNDIANKADYGALYNWYAVDKKFDNWFLPSLDELQLMYDNLHALGVGEFDGSADYWSSSEVNATTAHKIKFSNGVAGTNNKFGGSGYRYRACHTFISAAIYSLGDIGIKGGLIFNIVDNGDGTFTYYEAEPTQNLSGWSWINVELQATALGNTATSVGSGQTNTTTMISHPLFTSGPAKECNELEVDSKLPYFTQNGVKSEGWRVPSDTDWDVLEAFLNDVDLDGGMLKEIGITHWTTPNTAATDEYGFKALPSGRRNDDGSFEDIGLIGYKWTSTQYSATQAWTRLMQYITGTIADSVYLKEFGFPIRCMRDTP